MIWEMLINNQDVQLLAQGDRFMKLGQLNEDAESFAETKKTNTNYPAIYERLVQLFAMTNSSLGLLATFSEAHELY